MSKLTLCWINNNSGHALKCNTHTRYNLTKELSDPVWWVEDSTRGLEQCARWLDWWLTLEGSLWVLESSIITVAKHPWYVVNGSKGSSVHVCQLLNEALRCVTKNRKQVVIVPLSTVWGPTLSSGSKHPILISGIQYYSIQITVSRDSTEWPNVSGPCKLKNRQKILYKISEGRLAVRTGSVLLYRQLADV